MPRVANKEASEARKRIIETALNLFYKQGYLATGINQVIAESGVTKNTFYYHFPSKDALCVAYLQARGKVWGAWLNAEIESKKTPYKRFMAPLDFVERWLQECDFRGCAFLNIASEIPDLNSDIRKQVVHDKNEVRKIVKSLTKDLKASDKKYAKIDVSVVSESYYVLLEGSIVTSQVFGDVSLMKSVRKAVAKLVV